MVWFIQTSMIVIGLVVLDFPVVVCWIGIYLAMQRSAGGSLVWKDSTCAEHLRRATATESTL